MTRASEITVTAYPRASMPGAVLLPTLWLLFTAALVSGCGSSGSSGSPAIRDEVPAGGADARAAFVEVAAATGLNFTHDNGMSGEMYLLEIMGPGVGLLDYDNDGDLDVYLLQGHPLPSRGQPTPPVGATHRDRLFRNDLSAGPDGRPVLRFTDVTDASGIDARGYGMGVAAGDYDADGWTDLYVTNYGSNQLWRNRGDGTFEDVTAAAGADDPRWSVSAAFLDYDADGYLDLYVGNYVSFTLATHRDCYNNFRDYCSPLAYLPVPDRLLHNRGDGTFEDVTARSGLAGAYGNGLGVVTGDFDDDGRIDIYVTNDGMANQLWINQGNGRFEDTGLLAGCALNEQGAAEAGMGVTAADYDGDGDEDLFMTHLRGETNTLYVNEGGGLFSDLSIATRLGAASDPYTGFGTAWFDYDNDRRLDLMVVNGAVVLKEGLMERGDPHPLHEPNLLFRGLGDGTYRETSAGEAFELSEVSRGAAFGDLDNDGDIDVVVANNRGPARVMLNRQDGRNGWIGLRMVGGAGNRDMLGTRVSLTLSNGEVLTRRTRTEGSYASASDPRLVVGLGDADGPVAVHARWPDGTTDLWLEVEPRRWHTLRRGDSPADGSAPAPRAVEVAGRTPGGAGTTGGGGVAPRSAAIIAKVRSASGLLPLPEPDLSRMDEQARVELEHASARAAGVGRDATATDGARAEAYGELGILYHAKGLLEASLPCYHNARVLASGDARWPYYLARVYLDLGQGEAAREELRATLALAPDYLPAWVALGESEFESGRLEAASEAIGRALAIDPACGRALVVEGRVAMVQRRYADAVGHLEQALALAPSSNAVHYLLARAYRSLGDMEKAREHMARRGEIHIGVRDPWLNRVRSSAVGRRQNLERGISLARSGQLAESIPEFRKAAEVSPEDPQVRFYLGYVLARVGQLDEAAEVFDQALEIDPDHAQTHLWLGTILAARGRDAEAIPHYRAAIRTNPNVARAHLELGQALQRSGDDEGALEAYAGALAIDPANGPARLGRAFARIRLGRYVEARDGLEDDQEVDPDQPAFAHILARLLAAAPDDRVRDGLRAVRMAEALAPRLQVTGMGETLAMAYAEVGRFDLAIRVQRGVLDAVRRTDATSEIGRVERNLALYERRRACRTPWSDDDPGFRPAPPRLEHNSVRSGA